MGKRQNIYLLMAGAFAVVFTVIPLVIFKATGQVYSILDMRIFLLSTGYKYFIGTIGITLVAVLSFVAIPLYRNIAWQQRLIITNLVVNALLFAFVIYKYIHWQNDARIKLEVPTMQAGIIFPVFIEMLLLAALQKIRSSQD